MYEKELMQMVKKYLVAEMDSRDKTIAQLKSNLYSMTLDNFIVRAIDEFQGEVEQTKCHYCQQDNSVTTKRDKAYPLEVDGKKYVLKIKNYPRNVCKLCDNEYENSKVAYYLSKLMHFEIQDILKQGRAIPEEIDFKELIKINHGSHN